MTHIKRYKRLLHPYQEAFLSFKNYFISLLILSLIYLGLSYRALTKAEGYLGKRFGALASEALYFYQPVLIQTARGCRAIMNAYLQSGNIQSLDWSAQSCIEKGVALPESYLSLATVQIIRGKTQEAIAILQGAITQFEKTVELRLKLIDVLKSISQDEAAMKEYQKAVDALPENYQLALDALVFFEAHENWKDSLPIADRFKNLRTDNPEVKLVVARAFKKNQEESAANRMIEQAKSLLANDPKLTLEMEQKYPDLMGVPRSPDLTRKVKIPAYLMHNFSKPPLDSPSSK